MKSRFAVHELIPIEQHALRVHLVGEPHPLDAAGTVSHAHRNRRHAVAVGGDKFHVAHADGSPKAVGAATDGTADLEHAAVVAAAVPIAVQPKPAPIRRFEGQPRCVAQLEREAPPGDVNRARRRVAITNQLPMRTGIK